MGADDELSDEQRDAVRARIELLVEEIAAATGATIDRGVVADIPYLSLEPRNDRAASLWIGFDYFLLVQAGHIGGSWELGYGEEDARLAEQIIGAVADGRASEVHALWRSRFEVVLDDGEVMTETGYDGCLAVLLPLPYWTRWGRRVYYEAYCAE